MDNLEAPGQSAAVSGFHPRPRPTKNRGHPGRTGAAWAACRRAVLARDRHCGICHLPLVPTAKAFTAAATEVDHYPVTLAMMEARRMTKDQVQQLSTSPANCRAVHRSCHQGAGIPPSLLGGHGHVRRSSRAW